MGKAPGYDAHVAQVFAAVCFQSLNLDRIVRSDKVLPFQPPLPATWQVVGILLLLQSLFVPNVDATRLRNVGTKVQVSTNGANVWEWGR